MKRTLPWLGSGLVTAHAFVNVAHGLAHRGLGIHLDGWQMAFVALVIGAAPLAAAILLWTSRDLLGARILALSMAAALLFGTYYHYIAVSPDNVAHLPVGDQQWLFRSTSLLLVACQLMGIALGVWGGIRRSERRWFPNK